MKRYKILAAFLLITVALTSCAPPLVQNNPTPQSVLQSTPVVINEQMNSAISAAKSALDKQLHIGTDLIQLVSIEQVQWPDGCLGIPQPGIMCAMHVVDGYRITLSANDQTYEIRSNLDGSQIVFVDGSMPEAGRVSFTTHNGDGCQIFLITESSGVASGSCNGKLEITPFVESSRLTELEHFITTFKSFSFDTSNGSVDIIGTGGTTPSVDERRSISSWIKLVLDETQAGRSSVANGLVIGWHREGGLAGFCDDLSEYATGAVSASRCKNGQAKDLKQIWLDNEYYPSSISGSTAWGASSTPSKLVQQ